VVDLLLRMAQVADPGMVMAFTVGCDTVDAALRAEAVGVPFRADQSLLFHIPEGAIDEAGVFLARAEAELGQVIEQAIAVGMAAAEQKEQAGLKKAHHPASLSTPSSSSTSSWHGVLILLGFP